MNKRKLRPEERELCRSLLAHTEEGQRFIASLDAIEVMPMDDGGMGSLRFLPSATSHSDRCRASAAAKGTFLDSDQVVVSIEISVDNYGELFELDMWKVDFSSVRTLPKSQEIQFD